MATLKELAQTVQMEVASGAPLALGEAHADVIVQAVRRERMVGRSDEPEDYRGYCDDFAHALREFIADVDADE